MKLLSFEQMARVEGGGDPLQEAYCARLARNISVFQTYGLFGFALASLFIFKIKCGGLGDDSTGET